MNAVAIRDMGGVDVLEVLKTGGTVAQKPYAAGALQALEVRSFVCVCAHMGRSARAQSRLRMDTQWHKRSREHSPMVCAAGMRRSDCRGMAC